MAFGNNEVRKVTTSLNFNNTNDSNTREMEQNILSLLLKYPTLQDEILNELTRDDFVNLANANTFDICSNLKKNNFGIDKSVVLDVARTKNFESIDEIFLNTLYGKQCVKENLQTYISSLKDKKYSRMMLSFTERAKDIANNGEIDYLTKMGLLSTEYAEIGKRINAKQVLTTDDAVDSFLNSLDDAKNKKFLQYGFKSMDSFLYTMDPGLIILGARPAMGKTAFAVQIAENLTKQDKKVLFVSLEMNSDELMKRIVKQRVGLSEHDLRTGNVSNEDKKKILKIKEEFKNRLFIDDSNGTSINKIKQIAKTYKNKEDISCLMVDYLQLVSGDVKGQSRYEEVSKISKELKQLSRELKIPVIALCQLNRDIESRTDKKPINADLRDSGQIEQDADIIMFLHRDDYYSTNEDEKRADKVMTEVIVRKNRNGNIGTAKLVFNRNITRFSDYTNNYGYDSKPSYRDSYQTSKLVEDDDIVHDSPFDSDDVDNIGTVVKNKRFGSSFKFNK